jgi:DNA primase small subunit
LLFVVAAACPQFAQREFSFTLENDVYRRYLSFSNHIEFEKELIKMCPEKIDIGAVYSAKVKNFYLFFIWFFSI